MRIRRRARCCSAWTASTDRSSRSATSPGVKPSDEPHQHHLALVVRQRRERGPQLVEALVPACRLDDVAVRADLGLRDRALRAQMVERGVAGDPQEPGREGGGAHPVVGERPRQAREDLARDVLGVVLVGTIAST